MEESHGGRNLVRRCGIARPPSPHHARQSPSVEDSIAPQLTVVDQLCQAGMVQSEQRRTALVVRADLIRRHVVGDEQLYGLTRCQVERSLRRAAHEPVGHQHGWDLRCL